MKTPILSICTLLLLSPTLLAEDRPVVLSLSSARDFTTKYNYEAGLALRPQIVTRLVRDYNCVVLSRSICDSLATEGKLQRFMSVADPNPDERMVMAADYALRIHLRTAGEKAPYDTKEGRGTPLIRGSLPRGYSFDRTKPIGGRSQEERRNDRSCGEIQTGYIV